MNFLKDIIQQCHQRNKKPFRQRRTVVTPALYKGLPYQFTVYCARKYPVNLYDLEQADISFMPIGRAPEHDSGPIDFGGERFLRHQSIEDWEPGLWHRSWGIQVYTGIPSERDNACWHDLHFTYQAICAAPDTVLACIETLINAVANPLLTITKSGGLRFSCRIPDYLHPNTEEAKRYIYKHTPITENPNQRDVYLEVFGEAGYSRWDARYEILLGNLLDPPIIAKEVLFTAIDALRAELHEPVPLGDDNLRPALQPVPVVPPSLGSHKLNLAKPVSDNILAVRSGLSPLAIKRHSPMLHKQVYTNKTYNTLEKNAVQIQRAFEQTARITGLIAETGAGKNYAVESYLLNGGAISLNGKYWVIEAADRRFQKRNVPSLARWRSRRHRWDQVKEVPVEVRMANPFQHGNVCEDPERCDALEKKGGNPSESICPQCPVYTACQERGYLSQPTTLQRAKAQISGKPLLFLDPQYSGIVEEILKQNDNTKRLCIIDEAEAHKLFIECNTSKNILEDWSVNWHGNALGNFAKALLNVLETKSERNGNPVRRVRTVMLAFEQHEAELIRQMCQVNVRGKAVAGGTNENMKIPMPMAQAIQLGILDTETVQNIEEFPSVCPDPNWTLWHQLKRFFAYYPQDADAPMMWHNKVLRFWVPPVLHPSVKHLLLMSSTLSEQDLHRTFPDEEIEVIRTEPTPWVAGNQIFQIRTSVHPWETILNHDTDWDVISMSETGLRIFSGICAEIEREPSVKHAIITYAPIVEQLTDVATKENVCFVRSFKRLEKLEAAFEAAEVIWIVGTPFWEPGIIWRQSQILFGNDRAPLSYETEMEPIRCKDERIQYVYEQMVTGLLADIIGRAGLNRLAGKKVVLVSSMELPDITDRPETLLFDWEDFEVAGGLHKLTETIRTRERFEAECANLTADTRRDEVERILGCSSRQANRALQKLRGGNIQRTLFRDQILSLLASGEKTTGELVSAIEGHPTSVRNELKRLVDAGDIVKVRWGLYTLSPTSEPPPTSKVS